MALTDKLTAIANAIRAKTGKSDSLTLDQMPTEIASIETGGGEGEKPFDCHSVTFMYGDTVLYVRSVADGDTCADPVSRGLISAPTKESTAQYNYTFYGWGASDGGAADANILKNITSDKTVYAIFTATVRYYTITYYDSDGTTVLKSEQVAYGAKPSAPTKAGYIGNWTPEIAPVTGDASYVVQWTELVGEPFGDYCIWAIKDGVLIISGSGPMPVFKGYNLASMPGIFYKNSPIYPYASEITKVVILDGVTNVGNYTFYNDYTNITSVEIAGSVTSIGNNAFYNCTSLSEVNISSGVTSIGGSAFYKCTALKQIEIPNSVTNIGSSAFSYTGLTEVNIPAGITKLDGFANTAITSITIPSNITEIGEQCFFYCKNLASVTLSDGLITIGTRAFESCSALSEINIPSTVTTVEYQAFSGCTALKQIEIPASITSWGSSVFYNCGLERATLANGTTIIQASMFTYATALTEVNIPDTVTTIGDSAFDHCTALKQIEIPNSVTSIGSSAFASCTSLTEINIPAGVTSIGGSAFWVCKALHGIYVDDGNTAYCDIDGVLYNKDVTELICAPAGLKGSFAMPSTVVSIGTSAFAYSQWMTTITIPSAIVSISKQAFWQCNILTSATFENTVGWWVSTDSAATSGDAVDVSDPATNVTHLVTTHKGKYWKRT